MKLIFSKCLFSNYKIMHKLRARNGEKYHKEVTGFLALRFCGKAQTVFGNQWVQCIDYLGGKMEDRIEKEYRTQISRFLSAKFMY